MRPHTRKGDPTKNKAAFCPGKTRPFLFPTGLWAAPAGKKRRKSAIDKTKPGRYTENNELPQGSEGERL